MVKHLEKHPVSFICILVLVMLLPNLDLMNVTIMEARNFVTAREMINDNNWLLTTMNGEPRYQKPPLPTWITAIFGYLTGMKNVFALRFPSVLMILLTGVFTFFLSNKLLSNRIHSLINACIVITSFYVIGIAIEAPWDIYAHAFMLIGIYYLIQLIDFKGYKTYLFLAGVFIGFSFLSKGPISLYALLLPFLISYGIVYKFNKSKTINLVLVLILALIIGGWWFLYIRLEDPETFLNITKKETGNWSSYNVRPLYYYWSFFTQSGLWTIPAFIGLLYPYLKSRVTNLKVYKLSLLWTLFAVVLLSVIPEKKSRYLMPVLIPLAINTGFYIEYLVREFKNLKDKRETLPVFFNFGLLAQIGVLFPAIGYIFLNDKLDGFWFNFIIASIALFVVGLMMDIQLKKRNFKNVFYLSILLFVSILITGLPLTKALNKNANFNSISYLQEESKDLKIYRLNNLSPEIIWDFGDKIPKIDRPNNLENTFGLLTKTGSTDKLSSTFKDYSIQHKKTFDLNSVNKDKRDYKERLKADFYILTKR